MTDETSVQAPSGLQITKEQLKTWSACAEGYRWFLERFPQGGDYCAVQAGLRGDKRFDDVRWLADRAFTHAMSVPGAVVAITQGHEAESDALIAEATAITVDALEGGYAAQIGSSGYAAQIGSSGYAAQIGSSGDDAQINAEGDNAVIAVAGVGAKVRAGESGAVAVAYSDGTRIRFAVGYVGENLKALTWYSVNAIGEFVEAQQ